MFLGEIQKTVEATNLNLLNMPKVFLVTFEIGVGNSLELNPSISTVQITGKINCCTRGYPEVGGQLLY